MTEERKVANSNLQKAETSILKEVYLKNGFIKKTYGNYYRVVDNDLLQRIQIQKHSWDKEFVVNLWVYQLYQGQTKDYLTSIIHARQGDLYSDTYRQENNIRRIDHWYKFGDVDITNRSVEQMKFDLITFIFPFLDSINTNQLLADFIIERTINQIPYFKQPDYSWSHYYAGLLALRIGDFKNAEYLLNKSIKEEFHERKPWIQNRHAEVQKLQKMAKNDQLILVKYFKQNTFENINKEKLKVKE